jgi:hypothetical protein
VLSESLLALRPTNTMHQLGAGSAVPLFNARLLLDALGGRPLWMPQLFNPAAAVGVLRAAAHRRAVVGLCVGGADGPSALRRELRPGGWMQAAAAAVTEVAEVPPFAIHLQLPPFAAATGAEAEAAAELVTSCVQGGFTSFGLDLAACPAEAAPALAAEVLAAALDFELTICVALADAAPDPASRQLEALRAAGVAPDLVRLPAAAGGEKALADALGAARLAWSDARPGETGRTALPAAVAAVVGEPFCARTSPVDDAGAADPDRIEAMSYFAAHTRLGQQRLSGSLEPVLAHLVDRCG